MENTITQTDINSLIAACLLCSVRYATMKEPIYQQEAIKYEALENKLRKLCYEENRQLLVS